MLYMKVGFIPRELLDAIYWPLLFVLDYWPPLTARYIKIWEPLVPAPLAVRDGSVRIIGRAAAVPSKRPTRPRLRDGYLLSAVRANHKM
jgi:hypothetical protein